MDRKFAEKMIVVLQGIVDGKTIQERAAIGVSDWSEWSDYDCDSMLLDGDYEYRIKPEPREFWVYAKDGAMIIERDGPPLKRQGDWIKVREVLE